MRKYLRKKERKKEKERKKKKEKERKSSLKSKALRGEHIFCHLKLIHANVQDVHVSSIRTCLKRQTFTCFSNELKYTTYYKFDAHAPNK